MVGFNEIQAQLMGIDKNSRSLSISEVKQLASIISEEEQIMACLKGWYKGAVSLLCATSARVIILDSRRTETPVQIIEYKDVIRMQRTQTGWLCKFAVIVKDQRHEFRVWGLSRVKGIHTFMHRHILYVKTLSLETSTKAITQKPPYTAKNWRSLVRKVGNAATL